MVEAGIPQAQSTWDKDGDAKAEAATAVAVEVTPGVNGTSCGLYPACVAVGIKDGFGWTKKIGGLGGFLNGWL